MNRAQILRLIRIISDLQFQKDVWRDYKYLDTAFSFGETVNLLGDYLFFDYVEKNECNIQNKEDLNKVKLFSKHLLEYNEYALGSAGMFNDPNWISITYEASEVYRIISETDN